MGYNFPAPRVFADTSFWACFSRCMRQRSPATGQFGSVTAVPQPRKRKKTAYRNVARVLVQDTPLLADLAEPGRLPLFPAARLLLLVDEPVDLPGMRVNDDLVAVLDERDGAAVDRLGYDVTYIPAKQNTIRNGLFTEHMEQALTDDESSRGTRETAVSDERGLATEAGTHERTGGAKHLGFFRR